MAFGLLIAACGFGDLLEVGVWYDVLCWCLWVVSGFWAVLVFYGCDLRWL